MRIRKTLAHFVANLCLATLATNPLANAVEKKTDETVFREEASLEIKGLLTVARNAVKSKRWDDAESAFHKILSLAVPDEEKQKALLEMGQMFETAKMTSKVVLVYEAYLEHFRDTPAEPDVYIRLGRACRELGAFQTALAKFYNALHASLRSTDEKSVEAAKKLALKAQFEIAETHFAKGDYSEAKRFFSRLLAVDMSPADHELVQFRLISTTALLGDSGEAVAVAKTFLNEHPTSGSSAEANYTLAQSLQKLGRLDESAKVTLKLLKEEKPTEKQTPEAWRRWKLRTGSDLANALYEKGDAMDALTIYQRLAELDPAPESRWPVVYQMGLCFERLRLSQRALEAYAYIVKADLPKNTVSKPTTDLGALKDMAQWKMEYIRWATDVDHSLSQVLKPDWQTAAAGQPLKFRETPVAGAPATEGKP